MYIIFRWKSISKSWTVYSRKVSQLSNYYSTLIFQKYNSGQGWIEYGWTPPSPLPNPHPHTHFFSYIVLFASENQSNMRRPRTVQPQCTAKLYHIKFIFNGYMTPGEIVRCERDCHTFSAISSTMTRQIILKTF